MRHAAIPPSPRTPRRVLSRYEHVLFSRPRPIMEKALDDCYDFYMGLYRVIAKSEVPWRTSCLFHRFVGKEAYAPPGRVAEEERKNWSNFQERFRSERVARQAGSRRRNLGPTEKSAFPPTGHGPQPRRHVPICGIKATGSVNQPVPVATTNS